jgi:hypothetical protein
MTSPGRTTPRLVSVRHQFCAIPPFANRSTPLTQLLSSDAKKSTALATSSTVPDRPRGMFEIAPSLPLALFLLAACSQQIPDRAGYGDAQNAATSNVGGDPIPEEQPVVSLPAGTPVTVRLQTPVSSAAPESGEIFDAVSRRAPGGRRTNCCPTCALIFRLRQGSSFRATCSPSQQTARGQFRYVD